MRIAPYLPETERIELLNLAFLITYNCVRKPGFLKSSNKYSNRKVILICCRECMCVCVHPQDVNYYSCA